MAFQQLYYTSCEHGLLGYGGFQFNATTPGLSSALLREVENLTAYEPPRSMPVDPGPGELADYPVALSYLLDDQGQGIAARVVFAGSDYSGRPGNYFAHALVTDSVADFGQVLPVELWEAPLWQTKPVREIELPSLPGPPARGALDRTMIAKFLASADARAVPALLSAADRAMSGDRPVLLIGKDAESNADWIAALSYLLGDDLARRLSFTTYSHRPSHSRHQVIGIVGDRGQVASPASFYIYDASTGELPDVAIHPLATLLANAGVNTAGSLWRQAGSALARTERGFDEWYPLVAATALLQDLPLRSGDISAIGDWLASSPELPQQAVKVLDKLVSSHDQSISDERIADLQTAALRLRSNSSAERLELMLIERAYAKLGRGETPGQAVKLSSRSANAQARRLATEALRSADPALVLDLLDWTTRLGVTLPADELQEYGQELSPRTQTAVLTEVLGSQPAIRSGFITKLATAHQAVVADLFRDTNIITLDELREQPHLAEQWVLVKRQGKFENPVEALREIRDIRQASGEQVDANLLDQIWPGRCPSVELSRILSLAATPGARHWLSERLVAAFEGSDESGQDTLIAKLEAYPEAKKLLPAELGRSVASLAKLSDLLKDAATKVERGDTRVFKNLYLVFTQGDRRVRTEIGRKLPALLLRTDYLDKALDGCPPPIQKAFLNRVHDTIQPKNVREDAVPVAARVFVAMCRMNERSATRRALNDALAPVSEWNGGWRKKVRKTLPKPEAEAFEQWCEEMHGPRAMDKIRDRLFARKDG